MIPRVLAVTAALAGMALAHPYLPPLPPLPAPRRHAARLNGGRTVEDIRRDLADGRERAKVRHRCRWCRGVCTGPMERSPEDGPFDLPPVRLEPEDGPYLWCAGCCMWLDAGGWHAYSPQFDAETKRQRRGGRNLWLVHRGGLQAVAP